MQDNLDKKAGYSDVDLCQRHMDKEEKQGTQKMHSAPQEKKVELSAWWPRVLSAHKDGRSPIFGCNEPFSFNIDHLPISGIERAENREGIVKCFHGVILKISGALHDVSAHSETTCFLWKSTPIVHSKKIEPYDFNGLARLPRAIMLQKRYGAAIYLEGGKNLPLLGPVCRRGPNHNDIVSKLPALMLQKLFRFLRQGSKIASNLYPTGIIRRWFDKKKEHHRKGKSLAN